METKVTNQTAYEREIANLYEAINTYKQAIAEAKEALASAEIELDEVLSEANPDMN